ncbi:hypothetical protein D4764_17G0006820 [Takifugu flavidus]|uniref:Uncharacterized protein n=1 Tax=Takifugu flavidus TaxID=433684 RepID=A0A5C6NX39_9TELE|nr:hypothetical protein D4764_17G0006820 [Takifugu flavidus]
MVLNRKKVECLLRVKEEILPQVEEFKYPGVFFTSEGRMEQETGGSVQRQQDRVRSSTIREELGVEPLLLHVERSQMRRPPGKTQDMLERLPPDELEEVAGEREVWASLLRLLPPRPDPG